MTYIQVYKKLFKYYGPQCWWPGDTPFEVMVGAILTQNTAWTNVERAIKNLKINDCLTPEAILAMPQKNLAMWLKSSGYFNIKAQRLRSYCRWYVAAGQLKKLKALDTTILRKQLLSVNGVGPETADDILLYAFERPVFVIDAYTRRIFSRLRLVDAEEGYETLRGRFEKNLVQDAALFNEYHALIVRHAKEICKKRPSCEVCCLAAVCPSSEV